MGKTLIVQGFGIATGSPGSSGSDVEIRDAP